MKSSSTAIPALWTVVVLISLLPAGCKKNESGPVGPGAASGLVVLGATAEAGTALIGTGGGTLTINKPGTTVDGLQIVFPPDSYPEARTVSVQYAPIQSHQLGPDFRPISPLISIANGGGYASAPMTVKIPVRVPPGEFAMAFFHDAVTGELEGIPLVAADSTSITILTRHFTSSALASAAGFPRSGLFKPADVDLSFSQVVVSSIPEIDLNGSYPSGFLPGVDDWVFTNWGSYVAPGGHCAGQSIGAIWYYDEKKSRGSPSLWGRFDNDGGDPKTPALWQDDVLGYKFCSMLQVDLDWNAVSRRLMSYAQTFDSQLGGKTTMKLFAYALKLTKKPQLVNILGATSSHAIIAYETEGKSIRVADPNFPGKTDRRLEFNGLNFDPYYSGDNAATTGTPYTSAYYIGVTSTIDWQEINNRWREVASRTIGNGSFPDYSVRVLNDSSAEFIPLENGFSESDGSFTLLVRGTGFEPGFDVFSAGGAKLASDSSFELTPGKHMIGIAVRDTGKHWVGFRWVSVTAGGDTGIIPLALGNSWKYTVKTYNFDGSVLETASVTQSIAGDTVVGGERWYRTGESSTDPNHPEVPPGYITNRLDGLWAWIPQSPGLKHLLVYKYPATAGATYPYGIDGKITVRVVSTDARASVPAGVFEHCYQYEMKPEGRTTTTLIWVAPGIGEILTQEVEPSPGGGSYFTQTQVLESYSLH